MSRPTKEEILNLASRKKLILEKWEPVGQEEYERAVEEFVRSADKEDVIDLALAVKDASRQGNAAGPFSLYPILMAFEERFGGTPELHIEIYNNLRGAGGKGLDIAPDYLRRAYEADPMNYFVLWTLFTSHHGPTFPSDLLYSSESVEHEKECIRRILEVAPDDELAQLVFEWMEKHGERYPVTRKAPIELSEISLRTSPVSQMSLRELLERTAP